MSNTERSKFDPTTVTPGGDWPHRMADPIAAAYIGTTPATLRKSRHFGMLWGATAPKFRKVGRRVFYDRSVLDEWIDSASTECQNTGAAHIAGAA